MRTAAVALLLAVAAGAALWFALARPPAAVRRQVTVAAAADLRFAFPDVVAAFERRHPDVAVQVTLGSSGQFFAQLANDAPFDLFLSADVDYPRQLVEQGRALAGSEFVYAVGHLVVWVPNGSPLDLNALG